MQTDHVAAGKVYAAIAGVMSDLASVGISKDRKNMAQGYKFRSIDDVYNALAPVLSTRGVVILPRIVKREASERQSAKGGTMIHVSVEVEYDIVSSEDGSRHTVRSAGEAMDAGDKATNKALSAAYKYMAFQAFCIPTEGDDADYHSPEITAQNGPTAVTQDRLNGMVCELETAQTIGKLQTLYYRFEKAVAGDQYSLSIIRDATNRRKKLLEGNGGGE